MPFFSRRPTRIPDYDYSTPNYYFITICTHQKRCIFGKAGALNPFGKIALESFSDIEKRFSHIRIVNKIVMPNHIHGIISIGESDPKISLDRVIGLYKSGVSRKIHELEPELQVWQRSFHDHVIRDQQEYEQIWSYVQHNAQKWKQDCFYVEES